MRAPERLAIRTWGALVSVLLMAACGRDGMMLPTYQVNASLLSVKGGPVYACYTILNSLPPAGCGGVPVHGVEIGAIPGVHRFRNGTMESPVQHLVGTWDGQSLTLTQPPRSVAAETDATPPSCQPDRYRPSPDDMALLDRVVRDQTLAQHGILILAAGPCSGTVSVFVAVADPAAVSYLYSRFGAVLVGGWLKPLP